MTAVSPVPTPTGRSVLRVDGIAGWAKLYAPSTQLVLWERPPLPQVARFAREVLAKLPLEQLAEVEVAELAAFDPLPPAATASDPPAAAAFVADVRDLAAAFAMLTGATRLGVRLLQLRAPMCPRFHTDFVGVRLLTTYCGVGTEFLDDAHANREFLGHRSHGVPDEASGLLRPGAVVQRVPPFAVALLKGEAWPGNQRHGAIHRSPPGRAPRVLLSLDVLDQEGGFDGFDTTGQGRPAPAPSGEAAHDDEACGGCR